MKIMVAYDGTLQSKEALVYGMEKAREKGGEVLALHVFNSRMFLDYDVMGARETAKRESVRLLEEAKALISEKGAGIRTSLFSAEGNPEEEVLSFAKDKNVDVLLCPPLFKGIIDKYQKASLGSEGGNVRTDLAVLSTRKL